MTSVVELVEVGQYCPECLLVPLIAPAQVLEGCPCHHIIKFVTEHGVRYGVVAR